MKNMFCDLLDLEASQNMQQCESGGKSQQAQLLYFTESYMCVYLQFTHYNPVKQI